MDLFNIIGPVMIGPSSSHTAGAARIGSAARSILDAPVERADIYLYNSFAKTGKGHGTDIAIIGGLLGMKPDDEAIVDAKEIARREGVDIKVHWEHKATGAYEPNTAVIKLSGGGNDIEVKGVSVGGGRIMITGIDGYDVLLDCEHDTLMTRHDDVVGVVAQVSAILARNSVNIAYLKLYRYKHGEAMMTIEIDGEISDAVIDEINACDTIHSVSKISKL